MTSSSSDNDDINNNNNGNLNLNVQNFNQSQLEAKKTSVYVEQTINFNSEFESFIFQPFVGINLGVGKFTLDSQNNNNNQFNTGSFLSNGFPNLETNFFQVGASVGANFIISDTFVPFIKGRFTKEFHSISTNNSNSNNNTTFFNQGNNNINEDPDLDSTTISGIVGLGFSF